MLSAKRLREHASLFAAVLGVVALVSGLSVGLIGYLGQSADDGVRTGLATRAGADLALRASLALDPDAGRQDVEVRAAIAHSLDGIPLTVDRTLSARVEIQEILDGVPQSRKRAVVLSIADLPEVASLVEGRWPASPDEVSMQVTAAERLGVVVGDRLRMGDAEVAITGTWVVDDPLAPRWLGDALLIDGVDDLDEGPIIVDERLWAQLESDPRVRWTIVPDITALSAADLGTAVDAWNRIGTEWRDQVSSSLVTLERQGRFKRTALELLSRVDALQAIQPVVLLLLAAIALVTIAELGRLLTTTRATEIALLWSRGASAIDIARSTAVEAALAAAAGAAAGTAAALGALWWLVGPEAPPRAGAAVWVVPVAATVGTVLVVAGSAFRSARRQTVRDPSDAAGRARRLAGPGVVVLATAAAALSVWQLRLYGSPLTPTAEGGTDVDPIAVVAPALTLVAVVLLALLLFPRVASLDELATRRAGVARILAARTVARRLQIVAAPIVVVAVACSTLVVASGYATTWSDSFGRTSDLRAGAALHASAGFRGLDPQTIGELSAQPGVDAVAPVDLEVLQIGGDTGSIVAATPRTVREVATSASGVFDRDAAADAIGTGVPGPVLPDGTRELTLTTSQFGFAEIPLVSLQLMDAYGVLRSVPFDAGVDAGADPTTVGGGFERRLVTYRLTFGEGALAAPAPWQILALDVEVSRDAVVGDGAGLFAMSELAAGTDAGTEPVELDPYWHPESPSLIFDPPTSNLNGLGFTIGPDTRNIRMTPTFDDQMTDRTTPPVVISQQLADLYGLQPGDTVSFFLEDSYDRSNCIVERVVPAIPGAEIEAAVLIDLAYVLHQRVRVQQDPDPPRDFWIASSDPEAASSALRPLLPANTRLQTATDAAGREVLGSAAVALWLGAFGCLVLAVIAVVAVVRAQLRSRRLDVAVLRAIGLSSRDQAAVRRRELAIVLGYGALTGLIAGFAVAWLTVPQLARAAVVDPYSTVPTPLGFDLAGLGLGLAAVALALAIVVTVYTSRVAVQARTAIGAEEVT